MRPTEKAQRRLRTFLVTLTVLFLTPVFHHGRIAGTGGSCSSRSGQELICAIDLKDDMYGLHGLESGFSYEILKQFSNDTRSHLKIVSSGKKENHIDSLIQGTVNLVITDKDGLDTLEGISILNEISAHSVWVTGSPRSGKLKELNRWLGSMKDSDALRSIRNRYTGTFNPHKIKERGNTVTRVSPYDEIIRNYAGELGWDWKMVASVIYQESKFSIISHSPRGAQGLMQVMPRTGRHYGVYDLLDPQQNIYAGTRHLKRLQRIFRKYCNDKDELIKFTLAAYNAGEGRIIDCINLAEAKGMNSGRWDEIVQIIPLMRDESILEEDAVKLGKFQGYETIRYVDSVLEHYRVICEIISP